MDSAWRTDDEEDVETFRRSRFDDLRDNISKYRYRWLAALFASIILILVALVVILVVTLTKHSGKGFLYKCFVPKYSSFNRTFQEKKLFPQPWKIFRRRT